MEKRHGAPWWGNWKALELDMLFAAVGEQGKEVGASVTFHDATSGEGLRSRLQPYADADGAVSVWTSPSGWTRSGSSCARR